MRAIFRLLAAFIAGSAAAGRLPPDPRIEELIVEPAEGTAQVNVRAILGGSGRAPFAGQLEITLGEKSFRLPVSLAPGPAGAAGMLNVNQLMPITGGKAWTPAHPVLYQMQAALLRRGRTIDRRTVRFGLRSVALEEARLRVNGTTVPVRGLEFQPAWSLTLAARARAADVARELQRVLDLGFTMILAEPGVLDEPALDWCDRHGLLVTEGRRPSAESPGETVDGGPVDPREHDTIEMVREHRNHPSIVLWRIAPGPLNGPDPGPSRLLAAVAALDPGRPAVETAPWPDLAPAIENTDPPDPAPMALEKEFPTATALVDAAERVAWQARRHWIQRLRLDPAAPGFVLSRPVPALKDVMGRTILIARPAPDLLVQGEPLGVTLTVAGAGAAAHDTVLDYRLAAPGDDPAYPMPWRSGPPLLEGTAVLAVPALAVNGQWTFSAQLRQGRRILASTEERLVVVPSLEGSQHSFALAGDAAPVREGFGAWIIPREYSRQIVIVHPAALDPPVLAQTLADIRAGQKGVVLEVDDEDLRTLASADPSLAAIALSATSPDDGSPFHVIRAGTFGNGLPGVGRGQPEGWIAGELYDTLMPVRAFAGTAPHALAVSVMRRPPAQGAPERWTALADAMEVPLGSGRLVFCQYRLLEHLTEPIARAVFYRLLAM